MRPRPAVAPLVLLIVLSAAAWPGAARAEGCAELARPRSFDAASAMRAIFCEYDAEHRGTLIPARLTRGWKARRARVLATPLLAATYREGGVRKGVLAVQRQELEGDGEPVMAHAVPAVISVYVFREQDGAFAFEKGAREAASAGAHGTAPGGRLVRLGEDRFGLWFEGGDVHQGYTDDSALAISLSDERILVLGSFDTGRSNRGACRHEELNPDGEPCWGYEGHPELVPVAGEPFAILRLRYHGTEEPDDDRGAGIVPKEGSVCYARKGDRYEKVETPPCDARQPERKLEMFGAEESGQRVEPIPTVPRKLLR